MNGDRRDPVHAAAEVVLAYHPRKVDGDELTCLCGWAEIGKSHALHQVQQLAEAGLLVERLPA